MSKRKFNHIPLQLQNAVIAFTGSVPGVGKSYIKNNWAEKLSNLGYQVIITGSTNKASEGHKTIYSVADWTDMEATRAKKRFVRKEGKIYTQRSAFLMVDEAWMLDQDDIEQLKKQFPKCCILLFGDPNQFPPIEDRTIVKKYDEDMTKDGYDPAIREVLEALKKSCVRKSIYDVDQAFNLTVQYRVKTPELKRFLANVREGWADMEDAVKFLGSHRYNEHEEYDFAICRTWENGVYKYRPYRVEGKKQVFLDLKPGFRGVYVGQNNIGAIKNAIYSTSGKSFDSDAQITDMSEFRDERNYRLQGAVTCHSIQGSTFNVGTKVVVDFDDAMSIVPDEWSKNTEQLFVDFQRFVYIACSRSQSEEDLVIKCDNMKKFLYIMSCHVALEDQLKSAVDSDSSTLSAVSNPVEYLLSLPTIQSRRVRRIRAAGRTNNHPFSLPSKLSYDIKNNIIAYLNLGLENVGNYTLAKALGMTGQTVKAHRAEINYWLTHLDEYGISLEETDNTITTGKTIGDIMAEQEEEAKKPVRIVKGTFDFEKELGITDVFQFIKQFDSVEEFKKWLLEVKHIDWIE